MKRVILFISVLFLLSSCATLINGTKQELTINSEPAGASVEVDNNYIGVTPMAVKLSRSSAHTVLLSKEGYEDRSMMVGRSVNGWVAGNILFGGLIGLVIDAAAGGMYTLTPKNINVKLKEK